MRLGKGGDNISESVESFLRAVVRARLGRGPISMLEEGYSSF